MADRTSKPGRVAMAVTLAAALAAPAEGLRRVAYYDPPGVLTVCRGHTGDDITPNVSYSLEQCEKWFTADMRKAVEKVSDCAPGLPPEVLAAFGDAAFNAGATIACDPDRSTAARYLRQYSVGGVDNPNSGVLLLRAACDQLPRWDKAHVAGVLVTLPGLTKRRAEERALCLQGTS